MKKWISLGLLSLLSGCLNLGPVLQSTDYYDIGEPLYVAKKHQLRCPVKVMSVDGPFSEKIQFRNTEFGLEMDGDNRWRSSPQTLLKPFVQRYFNVLAEGNKVDSARQALGLEIELTRFDFDLQNAQGTVSANWNIVDPAQTENGEFLSLMRGSTTVSGQRLRKVIDPGAALSSASNQFCDALAEEIIRVHKAMNE